MVSDDEHCEGSPGSWSQRLASVLDLKKKDK
jgi:hypothetical protein